MTITNLHQRKITAAKLAEFEAKLAELEASVLADDTAVAGRQLAIAQTRSYIEDFRAQIADFDELAGVDEIEIDGVEDLGQALVRARVASGLTQAQLAERVGLKTSAVNRYEASEYRSANLVRLSEIAEGLDFRLHAALVRR